ncbi:ankyrin repeat-containing domain protein [Plectosphaerella plurivora]|uniref:Ankyrin repeat-containing domain protein n=1 Tax=Plectosphaerella plurivora TaxID=936078 RepID=A0A9P8VKV8_9PEZI|nr:ankyrin repeat-containing domain protein [Plectosphaerella plurivora]
MEAAGLAIGIVGLAGLFTTCQSIVDKFSSYQNFDSESRALEVEFNAYKAKFERWGQTSGISNAAGSDDESSTELPGHGRRRDHDPRSTLENPQTQGALTDVLQAIIDELNSLMPKATPAHAMANQMRNKVSDSKRSRLGWAVSRKKARTENIARFQRLVDALYSLVPPAGPSGYTSFAEDDTDFVQNLRSLLQDMRKERQVMMARDVHTWLVGSGFPNERYQESTRKRLEGTCSWIFEDDTFQDWRSSDTTATGPKIMWIHGPAGFGKTILSARIVEELSRSSDKPVAHFFYSSGLEGCDDPFVAARSWISQIAARNESALNLIRQRQLLDVNPTAGQTTTMEILSQIVKLIPGCTLIADGLDECAQLSGDGASASGFLRRLLESVIDTEIHLLVVSRDELAIRLALEDGPVLQELRISPNHVRTDTVALSRDLIDQKLSNKNEAVRSEVSTMLSDQCKGQFLWLKLQADRLRRGMTEKQLQKTIETTPSGLDQTYDKIWQRMEGDEDDRDRIFRILRWTAFSRHPLTIAELAEATLIDEETGVILADDHPGDITEDFVDTEIIGLCGIFIEVTGRATEPRPAKWTVQLSHFTVRHFLLRKLTAHRHLMSTTGFGDLEAIQHAQLAKSCLHAVMTFHKTTHPDNAEFDRLDWVLPQLAKFAIQAWPEYYKSGLKKDESLAGLASTFFSTECLYWQRQSRQPSSKKELESVVFGLPPLDLAYRQGLEAVVNTLVQLGADLSTSNAEGWTPLHEAAASGALTPSLLAYYGQNIDLQNQHGATPLHAASYYGHSHVVRLLLENGAKVDIPVSNGMTSLSSASYKGHHEVVRQLLDANANVDHESLTGETPLILASKQGHHVVVQQLLDANANMDHESSDRDTALGNACLSGDIETARVLLHRGAQVRDLNLGQAIHSGVTEVFELLLDTGGFSNKDDAFMPLISACMLGSVDATALLLSRSEGVSQSPSFSDMDMEAALEEAVKSGNIELVRFLFENGFSVRRSNYPGWTLLHEAVRRGNLDMVELVLQKSFKGIRKAKTFRGSTSLHLAARGGKYHIAKLLIDYEVDVDAAGRYGSSAVWVAVKNGHLDVAKVILPLSKVSSNCQDYRGHTLLWWAQQTGNTELVQLLSQHDSTLDILQK